MEGFKGLGFRVSGFGAMLWLGRSSNSGGGMGDQLYFQAPCPPKSPSPKALRTFSSTP